MRFCRHTLATRRQKPGESIDQFLQILHLLARDCGFKAVSAEENLQSHVRDAFISGLESPVIRQRLLENQTLTLNQARALDVAQRNSETYNMSTIINSIRSMEAVIAEQPNDLTVAATYPSSRTCYFCGNGLHPRSECLAKDAECRKCGEKDTSRECVVHLAQMSHFVSALLPPHLPFCVVRRAPPLLYLIPLVKPISTFLRIARSYELLWIAVVQKVSSGWILHASYE
jgi:hypothetical protein